MSKYSKEKTAIMFPGQGAQYKGMGAELFTEMPELTEQADSVLGYSVEDLCINNPENKLFDTSYTQPAIYIVNAMHYHKHIGQGVTPGFLLGHSLGEYNALLAAGVFDFTTGLQLIKKRAAIMRQESGFSMTAVLGMNIEKVSNLLNKENLADIDIANDNSFEQVVVSGKSVDIEAAAEVFESNGASMVLPLNVSGAFHSRYMEQARNEYALFLQGFNFSEPKIPVVSNVTATFYSLDTVISNLAEHISNMVRWKESVLYLRSLDVSDFIELGPRKTLMGILRNI